MTNTKNKGRSRKTRTSKKNKESPPASPIVSAEKKRDGSDNASDSDITSEKQPLVKSTETSATSQGLPLAEGGTLYADLGIPINCVATVPDDPTLFVVGGGGGPGRSGVHNKLLLQRIDTDASTLTTVAEYCFGTEEDAPTCISANVRDGLLVCGANHTNELVKQGKNRSTRVFKYDVEKATLECVREKKVMDSLTMTDYQRVAVLSPKGDHLLTGCTDGSLHLLEFPSLENTMAPMRSENGELLAASFNETGGQFAVITAKDVSVFTTRNGKGVQRIECPVYKNNVPCRFRSGLYGRGPTKGFYYTVLNTVNRDQSLVAKWKTQSWETESFRAISKFPIIAVAMHPHGAYLAVATTDNAVIIVDAHSLRILARTPDMHSFAITSLAFTSDGRHLISGSIDNTCCVMPIPETFPQLKPYFLFALLGSVLAVLLAIVYYLQTSEAMLNKDEL
ncbi:hypothetical protein IWQ62_005328 [Dispira parvispora]|uniref:WD40 repeat-like protein n=1 Tax=Dispira parvispora TaxID=1520584 RepID=A0A9W8AJY8_9FUNG|nr:hypothetical protein IWQ62_005328 [Dispira parvispora]